jgi:hypothetical protein
MSSPGKQAAPPLKWMPLELRKASNLRMEVDDAVRSFTAAVQRGDQTVIDSYRTAFGDRIDELEEFYLANDDDERAVLFEKQRLRLRRVLQTAQQQGATKPDKSAGNTPASTPARASKGRDRTEARSAGTPVGASPSYQETQVKKTPVSGAKTKMGTTPVPSSKKKTKKPISPLYAWERPTEDSENSNLARRPVITEHGQFIPSDRIRGFYEQQHQEVSNKYVDFQIILSELEYQELLAKRRAQKARGKAMDKQKQDPNSQFLFSSMPYVDANRVESSLYRSKK